MDYSTFKESIDLKIGRVSRENYNLMHQHLCKYSTPMLLIQLQRLNSIPKLSLRKSQKLENYLIIYIILNR